jgi:hypothetical protein
MDNATPEPNTYQISDMDMSQKKAKKLSIFNKLHPSDQNPPNFIGGIPIKTSLSNSTSLSPTSSLLQDLHFNNHFHNNDNNIPVPSSVGPSRHLSTFQSKQGSSKMKRSVTAPNTKNLPVQSINPNININSKKPKNKFLKFTKKATKLASDIAFGSAFDDSPNAYHPYIPHFNPQYDLKNQRNLNLNSNLSLNSNSNSNNERQQLSTEYHTKLRNILTLAKNHSMEFYLDYLKFFLKYMDESELNDPFDYSVTRNSLWNQWFSKYLTIIDNVLKSRDDMINYQNELKILKLKELEIEKERQSEKERSLENEKLKKNKENEQEKGKGNGKKANRNNNKIEQSYNFESEFLDEYNDPFLDSNQTLKAKSILKSKSTKQSKQSNNSINLSNENSNNNKSYSSSASSLNSISTLATLANSQISSSTSINQLKSKINNIPSIEQIDKEVFQDRRIVLLLLWHNQILNKISNEYSILSNLLKNTPKNSEICIITSNKLKPFKSSPNESLPKLLKYHISPAQLELIDGWQLRHEFPDFRTNLINLTDRFQIILDLKNTGYLPPDLLQQYPHFNDFIFLSEKFVNNKLEIKERDFLLNYSSFTAPSIQKLPIKDNSQSLIYTPDFTRLVLNENDVKIGLNEFNRILKPGGSISLILFDISSFKHSSNNDHETSLSEYIQLFINKEICKLSKLPNLTEIIMKILKEKNFQKIKYVKLGIPVVEYHENKYQSNEDNIINNTIISSGLMPDVPTPSSSTATEELLDSEQSTIKSKSNTFAKSNHNLPPNLNNKTLKKSNLSTDNTKHEKSNSYIRTNSQSSFEKSQQSNINFNNNNNNNNNNYDNLPSVSDQPITSMYAMFSSFIDFFRISQMVDLHSWISDPENGHVRNSEYTGVAAVSDNTANILKLWLDWKLRGFNGSLVKLKILERLKLKVDKDGYDSELGVRLLLNSGDVWYHDANNIESIENYYKRNQGEFKDGSLSGLDSLFLVTAKKPT